MADVPHLPNLVSHLVRNIACSFKIRAVCSIKQQFKHGNILIVYCNTQAKSLSLYAFLLGEFLVLLNLRCVRLGKQSRQMKEHDSSREQQLLNRLLLI